MMSIPTQFSSTLRPDDDLTPQNCRSLDLVCTLALQEINDVLLIKDFGAAEAPRGRGEEFIADARVWMAKISSNAKLKFCNNLNLLSR